MSAKAKYTKHKDRSAKRRDPWSWGLVIGFVAIVGFLVINGSFGSEKQNGPTAENGSSEKLASSLAPTFNVVEAVTGETLSDADFRGKNLLLFFSEGVACQACMVQVRALERKRMQFRKRKLALVSVSVDSVDALKKAAQQYQIESTPLLADPDAEMSNDYDMLGKGGMEHPNQDGHAFMLVSTKGKILWQKAYKSMYVEPRTLFADMPRIQTS